MFQALMGICFSCRKPSSNRLNTKISEHISASVTPLHVCVEDQGGPDLDSSNSLAIRPGQRKSSEDQSGESWKTEVESWAEPTMANTISNMKIANPIKGLVSKHRKRFTRDGFDLDLTYINGNLIAMGFPAEKLESVYRNHIDDVVKFLEQKHKDHYKIYNLCSERSYDSKKFKERVATYAFDDHNPPKLELIKPFCDDVHEWLSQDCENVAAVHCKAGKGRTGVMVCCYLLHSRQFSDAIQALNFYGQKRTTDKKGVTIPSQRRYVGYYATLVQENIKYQPTTLTLREIQLDPIPTFNGGQGTFYFTISESSKRIYSSDDIEVRKGMASISVPLKHCVPMTGDIRVDFYNKKMKRKEKLFHFWFNTFFVRETLQNEYENGDLPVERSTRALSCDGTTMEMPSMVANSRVKTNSLASLGPMPPTLILSIDKWGLDDAHKDKTHKVFAPNFKVNLLMCKPWDVAASVGRTEVQLLGGQETPSESSDAESSECDTTGDEDGWESVDMDQRVGRYRLLSDGGMIDVL